MVETQKTDAVEISELTTRCLTLSAESWRMVQISCTGLPGANEVNYTFDRDYEFYNLRIIVPPEETIPSIQSVYPCAFLYENEIRELFGVKIAGMAVDFNGSLYKISQPTPFSELAEKPKELE